ncbi:MAG: hypothetical protein Tsb005_07030 [Gammaproteobacteria bacterium]
MLKTDVTLATTLDKNNYVIVRVWTSPLITHPNQQSTSIGHVSIEVPSIQQVDPTDETRFCNLYISLWPARALEDITPQKPKITSFFQGEKYSLLTRPEDDVIAEGREPDIMYAFYSFKISQISQYFENQKKILQGWVLLGGNMFATRSESCVTFAYKILKAGDLHGLLDGKSIPSLLSPDEFAIKLTTAKQREIKLFPETQTDNYKIAGESDYTQTPRINFPCAIM